jgi:hypothetical protein
MEKNVLLFKLEIFNLNLEYFVFYFLIILFFCFCGLYLKKERTKKQNKTNFFINI